MSFKALSSRSNERVETQDENYEIYCRFHNLQVRNVIIEAILYFLYHVHNWTPGTDSKRRVAIENNFRMPPHLTELTTTRVGTRTATNIASLLEGRGEKYICPK